MTNNKTFPLLMAYSNNQHFFNFFIYWIWTCDSDVVNVKEVLDEVTICRHRMCNLSRKPSSYSQRKLFVSEAYKKLKRVMFTKWCHMKCVLSFFSVCFLTLIMLYKLTLIVIAITHSRNFQNRIINRLNIIFEFLLNQTISYT